MRPPSATGLFVFHDTGPPRGSRDYTTLVIVHGHSWHSGVFAPLLPYARQTNTRIILVNRRDYPGAAPYTASELALLPLSVEDLDLTQEPDELEGVKVSIAFFMKHRGHELLRFLTGVVRDCNVPQGDPRRNAGGIVLVGWSLGVLWANAVLAHAASFHHDDVNLSRYLRRVVLYDGASFLFGFPRPDNAFNPYLDPRPDADSDDRYDWVSGYFTHGDTLETLSMHTPARDRPPTMARMTSAELARCLHRAPGDEGGSDELLVVGGHRTGAFGDLWQAALELAGPVAVGDRNDLREVEVRVVWCDRSTWEATHAAWCVAAELEGAREKGRLVRKVTLARVWGANHFVHWDDPEIALQAFLCDTGETEEGVYDT